MQKCTVDTIQTITGDIVAGAAVTVYIAGTPGLATIYSDDGVTPATNPITSDSLGQILFYAANGRYDLVARKTGYTDIWYRDVLFEDPHQGSNSGQDSSGAVVTATGRTPSAQLSDRFAHLLDIVDDFGGDFNAFFTAVNASANGLNVKIPSGTTITLSATVTASITKPFGIYGFSKKTCNINGPSGSIAFDLTLSAGSAYQSEMDGFAINGASTVGMKLTNFNACRVGIRFSGQTIGIDAYTSYGLDIRESIFQDCGTNGFRSTTTCHGLKGGARFYSCGLTGSDAALKLTTGSFPVDLSGIDCEGCYRAISVNNCTSVNLDRAYIEISTASHIAFLGACGEVSISESWIGQGPAWTISNIDGLTFKNNTVYQCAITVDGTVGKSDLTPNSYGTGASISANWVQIEGVPVGTGARIRSAGNDANVDLRLSSKGTGSVLIEGETHGRLLAQFSDVANGVNYLIFKPAITGSGPEIDVWGTDTNADLVITPKGTGVVKFNNTTANGAVATVMSGVGPTGANTAIQGWLKIKDSAGNARFIPYW